MRLLIGILTLACLTSAARADNRDDGRTGLHGWGVRSERADETNYRPAEHGYEAALDRYEAHGGRASALLRATTDKPSGYIALVQALDGRPYQHKRVRVSAWIKSDNVAQAWFGFKTFAAQGELRYARAQLRGSTGWQHHAVVLDVDGETQTLGYGLVLNGTGKLWIDDVTVEVVDASVPASPDEMPHAPPAPRNLDFEE